MDAFPSDRQIALLLTSVLPLPGGSGRALRAWHWLQDLARDYRVRVVLVREEPVQEAIPVGYPAESVEVVGARMTHGWRRRAGLALPLLAVLSHRFVSEWWWPHSLHDRLERADGNESVARIVAFRLYLHDVAQAVAKRYPGAIVDMDMDDLESSTRWSVAGASFRMGHYRDAWRSLSIGLQYRIAERCLGRSYRIGYLAAGNDLKYAPRIADATASQPNRMQASDFFIPQPAAGEIRLLFVGTLNYPPNEEAVRFLIRDVVPRLTDAIGDHWRLRIVGRYASSGLRDLLKAIPRVELIDNADTLDEYYKDCHVVLAPIQAGGGTKIKVLEAFSYCRPVIATKHGVRGLESRAGVHYLHAETSVEFVSAIARLASDRELAERIARAGWVYSRRFSERHEGRERPHGLVLHDYLQVRGGAERLVLTFARRFPEFYLQVASALPDFEAETFTYVNAGLIGRLAALLPRVPRAILSFAFARVSPDIDCVIYSGLYAPLAVEKQKRGKRIYYCHTPPRFAFDREEEYLRRIPVMARPFLRMAIVWYRRAYLRALGRMDTIIVNSENIQRKLQSQTGIDAQVIYPPIDTENFRFLGQEDYYLSVGRLEPNKRVDRIVRAFLEMPDKLLIVASGGTQLEALRALAGTAPNIKFSDWLTEECLVDLVGRSIAAIYIPRDEDFGMSAVEAMAAGKPVIGTDDGGLRETIVHGETGIMLSADPTTDEIISAVRSLTPDAALAMRQACEARAKNFSEVCFIDSFQKLLEKE